MANNHLVVNRSLPLKQRIKNWIWKTYKCPKGIHQDKFPDGSQANFCGICSKQMVHDAYKRYRINLRDGNFVLVTAVNTFHARNMAIYGDGPTVANGEGEIIQGEVIIHPDNIRSIKEVQDEQNHV